MCSRLELVLLCYYMVCAVQIIVNLPFQDEIYEIKPYLLHLLVSNQNNLELLKYDRPNATTTN